MSIWLIIPGLITLALALVAWACCVAAGKADEKIERFFRGIQ